MFIVSLIILVNFLSLRQPEHKQYLAQLTTTFIQDMQASIDQGLG
jgi:hypothetical protein